MTIFSRYYNKEGVLIQKTMSEMEALISDENNRKEIAESVYYRLYERFLKIFFYESSEKKNYQNETKTKNVFKKKYKNGFLMMTSACLLIENLAAYLQGNNKTAYRKGNDSFNFVFKKCNEYQNELKIFHEKEIYKNIRNGLMHQGETYDQFKISRTNELFCETDKKINATLFIKHLHEFLLSYKSELENKNTRWDSKIWDNCRAKIRHIISNSKSNKSKR